MSSLVERQPPPARLPYERRPQVGNVLIDDNGDGSVSIRIVHRHERFWAVGLLALASGIALVFLALRVDEARNRIVFLLGAGLILSFAIFALRGVGSKPSTI